MRETIAAARSQADYYRISLEILRFATPLDVTALADDPSIPRGVFKVWLTRFREMVINHNPRMTMYRQSRVASGITFYSSGGNAEDKVLLVGLCGRSSNLCCATAMFLQYFPDERYDLVVLRDENWVGFTTGILGYASSLQATVERLQADVEIGRYRETRSFGVSSGGSPALLVGSLLKSARAICIGGKLPTDSEDHGKSPGAIALEEALRHCALDRSQAMAVYAGDNKLDATNARQIGRIVKLKLLPVPGISDHAIIEPLDREGRLTGLLREIGLLT
jgi:hypothetical protein